MPSMNQRPSLNKPDGVGILSYGGGRMIEQRPDIARPNRRDLAAKARGVMGEKLKAPFPWFGGKSRIASLVWGRLGDVRNFIEPFAGSLAVLLARPHKPRVETVSDKDCYLSNFWRSTQLAPEAVAEYADWPVNEADLHSRHKWLVLSEESAEFRKRMRTDPHYFDPKIAGWWCWGICCWIGGGWCQAPEDREDGGRVWTNTENVPWSGKGITAKAHEERRPLIAAPHSEGGRGVHAKQPHADRRGQEAAPSQSEQVPRPKARYGMPDLPGVLNPGPSDTNRPQLADAFSRGRGVNGNDLAEACAERRAWLFDWFGRLRDRLRTVRVCCGDWSRVCSSESTTTRLGLTGVFLDPPYGAAAGRNDKLYSVDSLTVAQECREWCKAWGANKQMRIILAGYEGEGHEELEALGWSVVAWKAQGGYGNRSAKGKENALKERLWISPHCVQEATLFSSLKEEQAA